MEKIKPILEGIKQHHFWILTGLGVVAILYCWNAAVGQMEEQFNKNKSAVSQQFTQLNQLGQRPSFPNEQWATKTNEVVGKVNQQAQNAWRRVVQLQKPSLHWPEDLGEDFVKEVDQQEWPQEMIEAYAEVAPGEIERLRTTMGAAENVDSAGVQWNQENYDLLANGFATDKIKTTAGCTIRQNVLWLYQSMAEAVAATNAGAPDRFNLPLHTVVELAVDNKANLNGGDWVVLGFSESGPPPAPAPEVGDSPPAAGGTPEAAPPPPPAPTPLPSLLENIAQPPQVVGYELRAFRLRVRMDLDYLSKLLAAIANSKIPLDIQGIRFQQQVRLNEIKPEEKKPKRPVRRGGLWGKTRPAPKVEEKEPEPEKPVKIERGTLVEIWGYGYFTKENEIAPTGTATQGTPATSGQAVSGRSAANRPS